MNESLFTRHIKNTINSRLKAAKAPDFEWPALLVLGTGFGQYHTKEILDEEFKNQASFRRYMQEEIPAAIKAFRAREAAFVKPVWVGRESEEGLYKPGVLVIQVGGGTANGWGAHVIRRPDVAPHIGEVYVYEWGGDKEFDADIRAAFAEILTNLRENQ